MQIEIGDLIVSSRAATNGSSKITLTLGSTGAAINASIIDDLENFLMDRISQSKEFRDTKATLNCSNSNDGTLVLHAEPYRPDDPMPPSATRMETMAFEALKELHHQYLVTGNDLQRGLERAINPPPKRLRKAQQASYPRVTITQLAESLEPCLEDIEAADSIKKTTCRAVAADVMELPLDDRTNPDAIQPIVQNQLQDCLPPTVASCSLGGITAAGLDMVERTVNLITNGPGWEQKM